MAKAHDGRQIRRHATRCTRRGQTTVNRATLTSCPQVTESHTFPRQAHRRTRHSLPPRFSYSGGRPSLHHRPPAAGNAHRPAAPPEERGRKRWAMSAALVHRAGKSIWIYAVGLGLSIMVVAGGVHLDASGEGI